MGQMWPRGQGLPYLAQCKKGPRARWGNPGLAAHNGHKPNLLPGLPMSHLTYSRCSVCVREGRRDRPCLNSQESSQGDCPGGRETHTVQVNVKNVLSYFHGDFFFFFEHRLDSCNCYLRESVGLTVYYKEPHWTPQKSTGCKVQSWVWIPAPPPDYCWMTSS